MIMHTDYVILWSCSEFHFMNDIGRKWDTFGLWVQDVACGEATPYYKSEPIPKYARISHSQNNI